MSSNGSMQFLGRQLQAQAKALQDIVLQGTTQVQALVDMTSALDRMVPKFAIASASTKSTKSFGATEKPLRNEPGYSFIPYINGSIRVQMNCSSTGDDILYVYVNGIEMAKINATTGTKYYTAIINVQEGDVVKIQNKLGVTIYLLNIQIQYDLIDKPDVSL